LHVKTKRLQKTRRLFVGVQLTTELTYTSTQCTVNKLLTARESETDKQQTISGSATNSITPLGIVLSDVDCDRRQQQQQQQATECVITSCSRADAHETRLYQSRIPRLSSLMLVALIACTKR